MIGRTDIVEMFRHALKIELKSEPGKASFYFGLALLVVSSVSGWYLNLNLQNGLTIKSPSNVEIIVVICVYFLLDLFIGHYYLEE